MLLAQDSTLAGRFVYVGGEAQRLSQQRAIEHGIDGMIAIAKPLARSLLRSHIPVPAALQIALDGNKITTTFSDISFSRGATLCSTSDGTPTASHAPSGERVSLVQKLDGTALVQNLLNPQGNRENRYELLADGETLLWHVTIVSNQLPHAIAYTLTYRRASPVTAQR